MITEQRLREQLDHATADVLGGPDLATTLASGRARRRTRALARAGGAALATAAALSVAAVVSSSLSSHGTAGPASGGLPDAHQGVRQVAPRAAAGDWVPGTDVDQRMAATIEKDLPALPAPDDVYCSDWSHRGKMPNALCPGATDWQATYTLADGHTLLVLMGYPAPYETAPQRHVLDSEEYDSSDGHTFFTGWVTDEGFEVTASETVPPGATGPASIDPAAMKALVQDPELTFAAPAGYVRRPAGDPPVGKSPF